MLRAPISSDHSLAMSGSTVIIGLLLREDQGNERAFVSRLGKP